MWLAAVLGLGIGVILNICADRLPQGGLADPLSRRHAARWGIVLLMIMVLRSQAREAFGEAREEGLREKHAKS